MQLIFTSQERIEELKEQLRQNPLMKQELIRRAEEAMQQKPLSVTFYESPAASGDVHDYYSEGPYWWPDPENPEGPYIRRDGEVNPGRFQAHHQDLGKLTQTVSILAQAGLFLEEKRYHEKAMELIRVWFLDEETCMNPNLNHGQAIRNVCDGRGIGIIDTTNLLGVVHGVNLIEYCRWEDRRDQSECCNSDFRHEIAGLKEWFRSYLHWMNTSKNGLEEKHYHNNHANWWNTQAAAYSAFIEDEEFLQECFQRFQKHIIPNQTGEDGSFTDELTRTRSYHYTIYNLNASAILCEIAWYHGVDLWHAVNEDEKGIRKSVEFFKPYYHNPFAWEYQEISPNGCWVETLSMRLAACRLEDAEIQKDNDVRRKNILPCSNMCHLGIQDLI